MRRRRKTVQEWREEEEYSHLVETLLGPWKRRARKNSEVWKKRSEREKVRRYAIDGWLLASVYVFCK